MLASTILGRFSFRIRLSSRSSAGGGRGPTFGGLTSATSCLVATGAPPTGPPVEDQLVTLTWSPATDPSTPGSQIVYEIFYSRTPGGEDFSLPTLTTAPGATRARVVVGNPAPAYFVVRARDLAGIVDGNTVEREATPGCGAGG